MERLAKDMMDRCGGLPLAIVVLSGLLSYKRGFEEWQKVKDHLWQHIKDDSIEISYILSLSYNDLPTALKQCFLYFGIIPEDHEVHVDHILWLWMAEGFIPTEEEIMEDVAEGFLNELIRRSLIQVVRTFWEKVSKCRIHDLLRDLAVQKALEVNFCDIYDPRKHSISALCLRHAIHSQGKRKFVPRETADLINLRHLVVSYSKPLKLISKLTSFQVLKAIHCDRWKDVDPVDLVNLRELTMHDITKTYSLNNISSLKNLSSLKLLCKDCESFPALEFLYSCQKLHKLWLQGRIEKLPLSDQFPNSIIMMILSGSELTEDPMPTLGMLPNLRNLDLFRAYGGKEITCIDNRFSQLEILRLDCLENLERWHLATSAMPHIKGFAIRRCPKLHEIPDRMKDVETLKRDHLR
ncbi:hypothetical protein KY290_020525 [Solanum tuberosum]|uniref:NB-ARC domain-containing protein n=1 Tax=Solanum tuberosum TaxID=4113 RepID=A0ABQ7UYX6_SOLTU|nr:hypothetical protein KY290_020525 [Solanum tuberosum]